MPPGDSCVGPRLGISPFADGSFSDLFPLPAPAAVRCTWLRFDKVSLILYICLCKRNSGLRGKGIGYLKKYIYFFLHPVRSLGSFDR